jgi:hypothetical protein
MRSKVAVLSVMVVLGVTVLSGCVVTPPLKTNQQFEAHSEDVMGHQFETMKAPVPTEGSLWTDAGSPLLFVDIAHRQTICQDRNKSRFEYCGRDPESYGCNGGDRR